MFGGWGGGEGEGFCLLRTGVCAELWLAQSLNSPLAAPPTGPLPPPPPSPEFVYSALGMKVGGKQMGFHELWK